MSQLIKLCIGLSLLLCVVGKRYHHCGRNGQSCMDGGTCNRTDGSCSCLKDRVGPKCEFFFDDDLTPNCTLPCLNNGRCYARDSTGKSECVCLDDRFYGEQCEKDRVSTKCEGETMHITVVPYPSFSGLVLIPQNRSHSVCDFNRTMDGNEAVHALSVNITSNECSVNEITKDNFTTYSVDVMIQNSGIFKTSFDMTVSCKCMHSTKAVVPLDTTGPGLNNILDPETVIEDQTKTVYEPVSLQVQTTEGLPVTKIPLIGDPLRIYLPLSDTEKYTNLSLVTCVVTGGSRAPIKVIDNGCINAVGDGIFYGGIQYNDSVPAAYVNFNAFRFPDNVSTTFSCNVTLCNASEVCDRPSNCGNNRVKRNAPMQIPTEGVTAVETTLTVAEENSKHEKVDLEEIPRISKFATKDEESREGSLCALSGQVITILIVLVVVVVVLMVSALAIVTKAISFRSKF